MISPEQVLSYWIDEVGPKGWYAGGEDLDAAVRDRFLSIWQEARDGAFGLWLTSPVGTLGYIVLMDQFPRNMHRGAAEAFATDQNARAASKLAIDRDWDLQIDGPAQQFFYLPLMHSENLVDQDRCCDAMKSRLAADSESNLRHARAHRDVIHQFGRFPYRNTALGRETTADETAWMKAGGYTLALRAVDEKFSD